MSPTPRQLRTDALLEKVAKEQRAVTEDLQFLSKAIKFGDGVVDQILVLNALIQIAAHQATANAHLLLAIENMAAAPAFGKQEDDHENHH